MIYKFKSPAAGDVIMLQPQGEQLLRVLGREPAAQGIIEPAAMPAAIAALQAAIDGAESPGPDDKDGKDAAVGLRQRLWPMVEMLRRAQAAEAPVVWGV
jgi:hypothetical protein